MPKLRASPMLASLLFRHGEALARSWARLLYTDTGAHYRTLSIEALEPWCARGVEAIATALTTGTSRSLDAHVRRVGLERQRLGFEVGEVLSALMRVRPVVLPLIFATHKNDVTCAARMIDDLDTCVRLMVSRFGQTWAAAAERSLRGERDRNALLLETGKAVGESMDLETTACRVASYVGRALGASSCCVVSTQQDGRWRSTALVDCAGRPDARDEQSIVPYLESLRDEAVSTLAPAVRRHSHDDALFREHPQIVAAAAVPVTFQERLLAVVLALAERGGYAFTPDRLRLAQSVAGAVAPALAHAQLYAESVRNLNETRSVQRVTSALLDRIGLKSVLELICRETQHLTGASGSAVLLVEDRGKLEIAFSTGDGAQAADRLLLDHVRSPAEQLPVEPLLVNELRVTPAADVAGVSSLLAVPLRAHGEIIGAMQLVNKHPGFDQDDMRIIGLIADQVAMTIENARLNARQERMAVLEERQRLARDLHDSVTQSVYGVSTLAEAAARMMDAGRLGQARDYVGELRGAALSALRQMRHLIFELHPPDIEKLGLVATLQARLAAVEDRAGLRTELRCEGIGALPLPVARGLYRIVQEAFHNSVKHARASRIALYISQDEGEVRLEIQDDGLGFDLEAGRAKRGLGLSGMQERAAELGGSLDIQSEPGRGTHIVARVPVDPERAASEEPAALAAGRTEP